MRNMPLREASRYTQAASQRACGAGGLQAGWGLETVRAGQGVPAALPQDPSPAAGHSVTTRGGGHPRLGSEGT